MFERGFGRKSAADVLGIPEKAVRKWQQTYRAVGRDGLLNMGKKHARYDFETKVAAASAVVDGGMGKPEAMERFGGNAALYERLALKFLDDAHFAALEQALADGDVDTAVREAHTLKGVAGNLSFTALYEAASKVNAALREGDLAEATARMDPIRNAHAAVVSALGALRDER